jgi:hypothetical protein
MLFITLAMLVLLIAFFIATIFIDKKVFPKIYAETSKDPFTTFHKVLIFIMGASMLLIFPFEEEVSTLGIGIAIEFACVALLVLLNLKYKEPAMIAKMTAIHTVYGIGFSIKVMAWIISFAFNLGMSIISPQGWKLGSSVKLFGGVKSKSNYNVTLNNTESNVVDDVNAAMESSRAQSNAAYGAQRAADNERAEAYAQSQGFGSAEEAESYGIKTGKRD